MGIIDSLMPLNIRYLYEMVMPAISEVVAGLISLSYDVSAGSLQRLLQPLAAMQAELLLSLQLKRPRLHSIPSLGSGM